MYDLNLKKTGIIYVHLLQKSAVLQETIQDSIFQ